MEIDIKRLEQEMVRDYLDFDLGSGLGEAVIYSLLSGGKRLRPLIFLSLVKAFGLTLTEAHYRVAAALEMIHTGSLIHDDLPAMDNDSLRRGKATSHVQFGETKAILAGDALFLDPMGIIARSDLAEDMRLKLISELSLRSGSRGMVLGQMLDMAGEDQSLSLPEVEEIHHLKTGRLLSFPFIAAGLVGKKSEEYIGRLDRVGMAFGLAFQIRDDILDATAETEVLGKTAGKDLQEKKGTYVTILGLDGARLAFDQEMSLVKSVLSELDLHLPLVEGLSL